MKLISQPVGWPNANVHWLLKPGTCCENKRAKNRVLFQWLVDIWDKKEYVRFDCAISNNGMKTFDKTLTYLYYIEISVAIKIKFCLLLILKIMRDFSAKTENKDQCTIINKFMYEKLCYKISTSKYEILNRNINISKIWHLPFDILCYLLEYMMTLCKLHWQSASTLKLPMVQNCAHGTTKKYKKKRNTCVFISMTYTKP